MAVAGTHWVPVDPFGLDAPPTASFQGVVQTQHQGTKGSEGVHQQDQQQTTGFPAGPGGPVQDSVIVLEAPGLAQAHDPQGGGDGALAWGRSLPLYLG
jgi:hypothetical protein